MNSSEFDTLIFIIAGAVLAWVLLVSFGLVAQIAGVVFSLLLVRRIME